MEAWEFYENGEVRGLPWDRGEMARAIVEAENWKRPKRWGGNSVIEYI